MKSYLLDTSIIINFLRNKKETVDLINQLEGEITSSYICLAELYEGIHRTRDKKTMENIILNFFARLSNIFGINQETAAKFGQIRAHLKNKGNVIEDIDILIAATCIINNQILVTNNQKHFAHVPGLEIF